MEDLQNLQILWYALVFFLLLGYSLLDGFDLGIGMLLPFIARRQEERDVLVHSIGPVWDGNEVWLITGGGALFAAFPQAYATAFSGFYVAIMLTLFALIFRAVSMEFRAHDGGRTGLWEKALFAGSALATFLFGVALGNVIYGVPLDPRMEFRGDFFTLLRPVPLVFGATGLAAVLLQGGSYAVLKTEGDLQDRAFKAVRVLLGVNVATAALYFVALGVAFPGVSGRPPFYAGLVLTLLGLAGIFFSIHRRNDRAPFWESSCSFIGLWIAAGAAQFPNLIKASNDPRLSLTLFNSSTGLYTLRVMSVVALVGMPIVIGYTLFVYRIFKGKTRPSGLY